MAILQKKSFKRRFRKFRYKGFFNKKLRFQKLRAFKFLRSITSSQRSEIILKIWRLTYLKRYSFKYLKARIDSIRIKGRLYRYSRYRKRKFWKANYKKLYKRFYLKLTCKNRKKFKKKVGYYRLLSNFYNKQGYYRFLKIFVKYSRIKAILRRHKKTFKKRNKKILPKLGYSRSDKLGHLAILFQSAIQSGKKKLALKTFFSVIILLKFKYKNEFLNKYLLSLEKIRPLLYYKTMFISGKKYKIPVLMPITKSYKVGVRWLVSQSKESGNVVNSFFSNVNFSAKNEGPVVKYRKEYHLQSFENKTYTRFLRFLKKGF